MLKPHWEYCGLADLLPTQAVRLFFVEPTANQIGDRVFDVLIEGNKVIADLDGVKEAGASWQTLVKENDVKASGMLEIEFQSSASRPILSGIEIVEVKQVDGQR